MSDTVSSASPPEAALVGGTGLSLVASVRVAVLVFAGYYAGARLGFALTFLPLPISVLWPPNAIVLGALLVVPTRAWWLVVLAALPAHLLSELHERIPPTMVLSWYLSNMSEALIGAGLVRALVPGAPVYSTLRGMVVFLGSACVAAVVSSFLDSALVTLNGWGQVPYWELWRRRSLSNVTASLVIAPLVIAWTAARWDLPWRMPRRELAEAAAVATGVAGAAALGFSTDSAWVAPCTPLPFLLWGAMRFGIRGASLALAAIAVAAIWGAGHGMGGLGAGTPLQTTWAVQLFLIAIGSVLLCLAAATEERQRVQESLADLRHRLTQASRLAVMGEMAASIAHEVSQPMSAILGNVEAAQSLLANGRLGTAALGDILRDIRDDDLRAVEIVRHVRDLAKHRPAEIREFDLEEPVRAVLSLTLPLARHRRVTLESRCAQGTIVRGDPVHVQHALANLVLNAIDALEAVPDARRRLQVQVAVRDDGMAHVSVRDAGHGIEPMYLEQIFDAFFTTKRDGTGLGLSISRSLVVAQGGRIWAQNNADAGATVTFTVPLAQRPKDAP